MARTSFIQLLLSLFAPPTDDSQMVRLPAGSAKSVSVNCAFVVFAASDGVPDFFAFVGRGRRLVADKARPHSPGLPALRWRSFEVCTRISVEVVGQVRIARSA